MCSSNMCSATDKNIFINIQVGHGCLPWPSHSTCKDKVSNYKKLNYNNFFTVHYTQKTNMLINILG